MQFLYNIITILLVIFLMPYFLYRTIREKGFWGRIVQSFGFLPENALDKVARKNCIWIHASSVGEVVATSPIIKEFRREFPDTPILLSVVTNTGYMMANRIIKDAQSIIYFPLDLPYLPDRLVKKIKPRVFLPVETELWPNFLKATRKYNIPVMMVNGRISDKSVKRYKYMFSILEDMIGTVKTFAMQSEIDASYIIRLGADEKLVTVTGNTKFDQDYTNVSEEEKIALTKAFHLTGAKGIFLAGSTHKGEEEAVISAFLDVKNNHLCEKLIIAPRSILRKEEIGKICEEHNLSYVYRTEIDNATSDYDVLILDTIGELGKVYSLGDVCYIGGSLISHGGHNVLEPAAHGKAIIVGSNMFNFKDTHALFKKEGAIITVEDKAGLKKAVFDLFNNEEKRKALEEKTLNIVLKNKGASRRSALILRDLLTKYESVNTVVMPSGEKMENFQAYLYKLVHNEGKKSLTKKLILGVLYCFSQLYKGIINYKLHRYTKGDEKSKKLDSIVISIGNITVGGTGKTPTAKLLARHIADLGYKVAILNRGYRGKWRGDVGVVSDGSRVLMTPEEAGDEAYLLACCLPDIPVLIGSDRSKTGKYATENFASEIVILDDGYQHWQLKRDINILLVDAINKFGNGYILPRGTLREPLENINRADVCLITKVDQTTKENCDYIKNTIRKYNENAPIVESTHKPLGFVEINNLFSNNKNSLIPLEEFKDKNVMALSAIGNPASFEKTLNDIGVNIIESLRFPDHHDYTKEEIIEVLNKARALKVNSIILTDKDAVKFPMEILALEKDIKIFVISIEVSFINNSPNLIDILSRKIKKLKE